MREACVARSMRATFHCLAAAAALSLAGCTGDGFGDPGASSLASGQSCGTIRQELDQLDKRGTQGKVEAASQGKKLSAKDKSDVDRYNNLLNQYLGARCHV